MNIRKAVAAGITSAFVMTSMTVTVPARAQGIPVIDIAAIVQLIQQIQYWQQQIQAMTNQLNQLQQSYQAITGGRGMETLLPYTPMARNYMPQNWSDMLAVLNGTSVTYSGIASQVQTAVTANSVLTAAQIGTMTPQMQQYVQDGRRAAAMLQVMTRGAQENTSQRFGALQQLISMVGGAGDDKAVQDLQARISAEQTMLTNEQNKLQALYQTAHAEQMAREQRGRELAVLQIGSARTLPALVMP